LKQLGIEQGKPIPAGLASSTTNTIYNVIGEPSYNDLIKQEQVGNELITTITRTETIPTSQVILYTEREAQKPRWDLGFTRGYFPYDGKQMKYEVGTGLLTLGAGVFGSITAASYGAVESSKFITKTEGRTAAWHGFGYATDFPEYWGDISTQYITASPGKTFTFTTDIFKGKPSATEYDFEFTESQVGNAKKGTQIRTISITQKQSFTGAATIQQSTQKRKSDRAAAAVFDAAFTEEQKRDVAPRKARKSPATVFQDVFVDQPRPRDMSPARSNAFAVSNVPTATNFLSGVLSNTDVSTTSNNLIRIDTQAVGAVTQTDVTSNVFNDVMNDSSVTSINTNVFTPKWVIPALPFWGGTGSKTVKTKRKRKYQYTPDFIAVLARQFSSKKSTPKLNGFFTGQERRYIPRGWKLMI
jgi:hypothetical protein